MLTPSNIEDIENQMRRIRPLTFMRLPVIALGFVSGMFFFYGLINRESQYVAVAGIFFVSAAGAFAVSATANRLKEIIQQLLDERAERGPLDDGRPPGE